MKLWYIKSFWYDLFFFFSPFLFVVFFTFIVKNNFSDMLTIRNDPFWLFLFIIVFDVAHVWWTLYRVYFDKWEFYRHKKLYSYSPIIAFLLAFCLFLYDTSWTFLFFIIWFLAVFHFIKQQVWFVLVYWNKEENKANLDKKVDSLVWWSVTLFPIIYWFVNIDTRNYIWFYQWEFIKLPNFLFPLLWFVFIIIILFYIFYEIFRIYTWKKVNLLKYFYIFITFYIWFNGIVWNNSLVIFAFWNVLLHWLNYFWISYLSTKNKIERWKYETYKFIKNVLEFWFVGFLWLLLFISVIEEYLWDQFFRNEHLDFWWSYFYNYSLNMNSIFLAIIIWLLSVPQLTHYYLDRYVWRKEFEPDV